MLAISDHQLNQALTTKVIRSFWLIGVLNNAPWVLMLACAPSISSGGVALVVSSSPLIRYVHHDSHLTQPGRHVYRPLSFYPIKFLGLSSRSVRRIGFTTYHTKQECS